MGNLADKYLSKKEKNIFAYSKYVKEMISYSSNMISKSDSEFNECLKKSISMYIDNYYFKSINNFDEYKDFFGPLIKCDNKFKTVFVCVYKNFNSDKVQIQKESLYLISLVVYTAIILDKFTYPYNNYLITMETVESIIKPMFSNVSFVKYKENEDILKEASRFLRKNALNEKKFFEAIDELNSETSQNKYQALDEENKYYKVKYDYKIEKLEGYTDRELRKSFNKVSNGVKVISYELATLTALKLLTLNRDEKLLYPVELLFYDKDSELNKIVKLTESKSVLEKIFLLVNYKDYEKNKDIAKKIINNGFKIAFDVEDSSRVPYMAFQDSNLVFINSDFSKENESNMETWKETGIEFNIKKNNEIINEKKLLKLEE